MSEENMAYLDASLDAEIIDSPGLQEDLLAFRRQRFVADMAAQGIEVPPEFVDTEESFQQFLAFIRRQP